MFIELCKKNIYLLLFFLDDVLDFLLKVGERGNWRFHGVSDVLEETGDL
jgi:hypothetical protein